MSMHMKSRMMNVHIRNVRIHCPNCRVAVHVQGIIQKRCTTNFTLASFLESLEEVKVPIKVRSTCFTILIFDWSHLSRSKTSRHNDIWLTTKTQISLHIRAVCSESSLCAQGIAKDPNVSSVGQRSDMRRLIGVCWAKMSFCLFCSAAAQFCFPDNHTFRNENLKTGTWTAKI